jgi:GxxExxY protein
MGVLVLEKESYAVIGMCMEVHNFLGHGFREVVYKDAIEVEARRRNIQFCREKEYCIYYKNTLLKHRFCADFVICGKIILEVKAAENGISNEYIAQTLNYLKASGCPVGLIINFAKSKLQYRRLVF